LLDSVGRPGDYVISVRCEQDVEHMQISHERGGYRLGGSVAFEKIPQMIEHFKTVSLAAHFDGVSARLIRAPINSSLAEVFQRGANSVEPMLPTSQQLPPQELLLQRPPYPKGRGAGMGLEVGQEGALCVQIGVDTGRVFSDAGSERDRSQPASSRSKGGSSGSGFRASCVSGGAEAAATSAPLSRMVTDSVSGPVSNVQQPTGFAQVANAQQQLEACSLTDAQARYGLEPLQAVHQQTLRNPVSQATTQPPPCDSFGFCTHCGVSRTTAYGVFCSGCGVKH
jgi:hypothetical protein